MPLGNFDYENVSLMQKALRRGEERLACRAIFAMLDGPTPPSFVFSRLRICLIEDLGPADPSTMDLAFRLIDLAQTQRTSNAKSWVWRMAISNLCVLVGRAPKWRIGNSLAAAAFHENQMEGNPEVPDWALDQHTRRGKAKGRGLDHFFEVGCKCNELDPRESDDPHFDVALRMWQGEKPVKKDLFSGE